MPTNYSWQTLNGNIQFKKQNYINSCFAAAYQNLCANLGTNSRHLFCGKYNIIENAEYDYMLKNHGFHIDNISPETTYIHGFISNCLNPLGFSRNTILNDGNITVDTLYRFGQTPNYTTSYILNYGDNQRQHACAFFIKKIEGEDHYILLDSCNDYRPTDFIYYSCPCSDGIDSLNRLWLYDNLIHGGMKVIF